MISTSGHSRLLMFVVFGLSAMAVPSTARSQGNQSSDLVQTAATKSESDVKPPIDEAHPLFKLLEIAYKARAALDSVEDYKCVFSKKEVLRNNKMMKTTMNLKLREKPFSVYLNFVDAANLGREVIYVNGQNDNKLLVHEGGFKSALGTFQLPPNGPDAMAENKYPVTSIGLRIMVDTVIKQWEAEGKFDGITPQKRTAKLQTGEACTAYEAIHKPYKEFKFHTTRLYIEDKTGLAIGVQQYGFPGKNDKEPPLVEEYFYGQLKTNQKFTDAEFDSRNPTYAFR